MTRNHLTRRQKEEILHRHDNRCINCGSTEELEFHHVVPLEIGGADEVSNIVPLCYSCHKAVTHHQLIIATAGRKHKAGGRKRQIPENYKDILWRFMRCEIGMKECKELLGVSQKTHLGDNVWFREFLEENGIVKYRNNVDLKAAKSGIVDGEIIGIVRFDDGRRTTMVWHGDPIARDAQGKLVS